MPTVDPPPGAVYLKVLLPAVKLVMRPAAIAEAVVKPKTLPTNWLVLGVAAPTVLGVVKAVGAPATGAPSTVSSVVTARSARFNGSVT